MLGHGEEKNEDTCSMRTGRTENSQHSRPEEELRLPVVDSCGGK